MIQSRYLDLVELIRDQCDKCKKVYVINKNLNITGVNSITLTSKLAYDRRFFSDFIYVEYYNHHNIKFCINCYHEWLDSETYEMYRNLDETNQRELGSKLLLYYIGRL